MPEEGAFSSTVVETPWTNACSCHPDHLYTTDFAGMAVMVFFSSHSSI